MGQLIDLTGERFGKLVVLERAENRGRHIYWKCQCDCGAIHEARSDGLKKGITLSCGHCDFEDLTGKRFGRRVVIGRAADRISADGYPIRTWICKCDCGTISEIPESPLIHLKSKSCGCITKEMMKEKQTKHNGTDTRLYNIWCGIKSRSFNSNSPAWKDYGGRGITMCDDWKNSFESFRDWALQNGYSDSLTIDRINVDGNYVPDNCRWVGMDEQARNKRNTIRITLNGITHNAHEWSEIVGLPEKTIKNRYHDGLTPEEILTNPYTKKGPKPVISIDKDGNIAHYNSIKEAAKAVGVKGPNISAVLRNKHKTSAGLKWAYDTETNQDGA